MRYVEWLVLFVLSGLGIALANFVGFDVGFMESLPGILVLLVIAAAGVAVSKVIPLKLPVVAYVSIIAAGKINFTAPLTMVGAYAGISISDQIRSFLKQGWKMILVGVVVMTGTFIGSAVIAQVVMMITGTI